ncbi:hypothetical protein CPB85DRAFT_1330804 [Mucidula mucida]|nr:hypothetical protein CPB85DRAFT_1330804 [Mucidula mucida]
MGASRADKALYFEKLKDLLAKFPSIFLVNVDNVGSNQMHQIRRLLPHVKGNIEVRDLITANKVAAPRIARGTIEIVSDVKVVVAGTRVGTSEATLLNMLNISPFTYGMTVVQIFDSGNAFPPSVLDVDEQELIDRFLSGIKTVAAISLALNYPTIVSVVHSLVNAYKNVLAVSLATEYTFDGSEKVKEYLANPEAFAAAAPAATEAAPAAAAAPLMSRGGEGGIRR